MGTPRIPKKQKVILRVDVHIVLFTRYFKFVWVGNYLKNDVIAKFEISQYLYVDIFFVELSAILGDQLSFADLSCPHVGRDFCCNRDCAVAG